ncbi:hypothetical protein [Sanguibacter sp. HDW7]|uniref:hypothetical protein n=1 Tax=Sanguibacter sp. HDW7 TaxID=2714931 RepID=UPI00140E0203|nr:hypothetical protein [Sanguibacter sp. HDW7]QIK82197.1 hypothetical protein G7063_00105 [Sanguibacter sp. HDW7]
MSELLGTTAASTIVLRSLAGVAVALFFVVVTSLFWDLPAPIDRAATPLLAGVFMLTVIVREWSRRTHGQSDSGDGAHAASSG